MRSRLPPGVDGWGYSLKGMMGMVVIGGLLITATYYILQRTVVPTCASPAHCMQSYLPRTGCWILWSLVVCAATPGSVRSDSVHAGRHAWVPTRSSREGSAQLRLDLRVVQ